MGIKDATDVCMHVLIDLEPFHRGRKQGPRAYQISRSDNLRFDAVVLRRTVGAERSDGVDVGGPVSPVSGGAVSSGRGDARFPRRSGTDRENVLRDRRGAYGAN